MVARLSRIKIRTAVATGSLAAIFLILAVGMSILWFSRTADKMLHLDQQITELSRDISELVILAHEYLLHREDRPHLQWHTKYQDIATNLQNLHPDPPIFFQALPRIRHHAAEVSALFERIHGLEEDTTLRPEIREGLEGRLTGQFLATAQAMLAESFRMRESSQGQLQQHRQHTNLLVLLAVLSLAAIIGAVFQLLGRKIAGHLAILQQGVARIADGRLDQPLEKLAEDEIGQLTDSINHMCHRLQEVTVSRQELAAEVAERRLVEEALRQAVAAAEVANRSKGLFLASMSHELRTPLNGVLGLIRLLDETPLAPCQKDYVTTISEAGEALLRIINDILDLSKIEAGRLELEQTPFEVGQVVGNVQSLMVVRCKEKGIALATRVAAAVPDRVLGDGVRLQQVLLNLVGNATKFTHQGTISLDVTVAERQGRPVLHFTVADSGIGIPPETLDHLFAPFNQADPTIHRRYGGTGLGLTISRKLVEGMGGEISLESRPEMGTTVRFHLPLTTAALPAAHESPGEACALQPLHVLLVEDDPISTMAVKGLLVHRGHRVTATATAEEALEKLPQLRFDAILMDVQLPGMDGDEATRRIRALDDRARSRLPVIGLTANVFQEDRQRYLAAGMDAVLAKPASPDIILATVIQVMQSKANRHPPPLPARQSREDHCLI